MHGTEVVWRDACGSVVVTGWLVLVPVGVFISDAVRVWALQALVTDLRQGRQCSWRARGFKFLFATAPC